MMTEKLKQIMGDIEELYRYEARRIKNVWVTKKQQFANILRDSMKITVDQRDLIYSLHYPLFPEKLMRLDKLALQKPEWNDTQLSLSKGYPENVIRWIQVNLHSWTQGDLLGRYVPEHRALEGYWLSVILKARQLALDCQDVAAITLINQLVRAFMHVGSDADGLIWKSMPNDLQDHGRSGLATVLVQYWTHYVIFNITERNAELRDAFLKLMGDQPPVYRKHLDWLECEALEAYSNYGITPEQHDGGDPMMLHKTIREHIRGQMLRQRQISSPYDVDLFTVDVQRDDIAISQAMEAARKRHGELGPFVEHPA
jgi:hypothetical protein